MCTRSCTNTHTRMQMCVSRIYAQWQKCISIFQHRRRRLWRQKIYAKSQLNIFISRLQRGWVIALFTALHWRMLKLKPSFNLPRTTQATWLHSTWLECPAPQLIHTRGRGTRACNECDINFARFKIKQKRNLPWSKLPVLSWQFPVPSAPSQVPISISMHRPPLRYY